MDNKKLLDFKTKKKAGNPKFRRQDDYKKKRLKASSWRKPRGWDSKLRKRMQAQPVVDAGYGSPKELRGMHKSGLWIIVIKTVEDLKSLDPKKHGIVVSGKLGDKKKLVLLKEAAKAKFRVLNIKDPESYVKAKESLIAKKKETKEVKEDKAKKEAKPSDSESIEDKLSEEDKKKLEKKEIDRLLTKKF